MKALGIGAIALATAGCIDPEVGKDYIYVFKELRQGDTIYLYGKIDSTGDLVVNAGEWAAGQIVDSRRDHPDYVFTLANTGSLTRKSSNPEMELKIVDKIVGKAEGQ